MTLAAREFPAPFFFVRRILDERRGPGILDLGKDGFPQVLWRCFASAGGRGHAGGRIL